MSFPVAPPLLRQEHGDRRLLPGLESRSCSARLQYLIEREKNTVSTHTAARDLFPAFPVYGRRHLIQTFIGNVLYVSYISKTAWDCKRMIKEKNKEKNKDVATGQFRDAGY